MKSKRAKILLWSSLAMLVAGSLAVTLWIRKFRNYTPAEVVQDMKAGIAARNDPRPVDRFLELRYGPLTVPANRQKAFMDFFNVGHIEGMRVLVGHMGEEQKRTNIMAMAQWVANYRQTMTPQEKAALGARFKSEAGHAMLRRATAQYLAQDVHYRAETSVVITELMATIAEVQNR
ncbi:MAG TPA: hypothetical protein VN673_02750 [Clostridia bacterium]|nr:hypothetical protein [Clostridia bacterium]